MNQNLILVISLLLIMSVFSSKLTSKFGVPILLLFLSIGMLVGSDFLNLIYFDNMHLTQQIANIALIFIIFESGFYTKKSSLRSAFGPSIMLATLGVILTTFFLGILIYYIEGHDFVYSLMIAAIISSTDAAAVIMILRQHAVKQNVSSTLEVESAANDPMAILLTIFMIQLVIGKKGNIPWFLIELFWQLSGGFIAAIIFSWAGCFLFNKLKSENKGYYYVLFVGISLSVYGFANLIKANGIIAVFFTGYLMGNRDFIYKRGVSHFIDGLSSFSNMLIFLLLGLLVFPKSMIVFWKEGIVIAVLMMFVVRPFVVLLCTAFFKFNLKEKLFISWGGVKGAVPIVLATYPAVAGLDKDYMVFNTVFFVVLFSCLLQGTTINWLGRKFNLIIPAKIKSSYAIELLALDETDKDMVEIQIGDKSKIAGKKIKDIEIPEHTIISTMIRNKKIMTPTGKTVLQKNDILFVMTDKKNIDTVFFFFNG